MCISTSVRHGPRRAVIAALGSTTAIAGIMLLSMWGLGAVLAASETLFSTLKWLGAGYLAYLGISSLRAKTADLVLPGEAAPAIGARALFVRGLLVGGSNPKALLFFGALFPQFINPAAPQLPQFLILGATFIGFELFWLFTYSHGAARARNWLQKPRRARLFNRATGCVFLAAAGMVASTNRNAI
jgi:threonine/homoserine/homoserine lactone efflux protein